MSRPPLKHNLENDSLYQLLLRGTAPPYAQQDAARWIKGLYEQPDRYDLALVRDRALEDVL